MILRLGRSPGEGNDNPLQYSYLGNPSSQRSPGGYSPCSCKESDTSEHVHIDRYRYTQMTCRMDSGQKTAKALTENGLPLGLFLDVIQVEDHK